MLQSELTSRTDPGGGGLPTFPRLLLSVGIAFVACLLAKLVSFDAPDLLLIWPCAGVAFAFAWRGGLRWSVPPALGGALWAWVEFGSIGVAASAFVASVAGPAAAVATLRRLNNWKPADYRLEAAVRFVGVVVLLAAPLDALLATFGLGLSGLAGTTHPAHRFTVWWLIDSLGLLLVAPALLAWVGESLSEPEPGLSQQALIDAPAFFLTLLVIATSLMVSLFGHQSHAYALMFLYFPIVAWTAIRMSERATALSLLVTAVPLLIARAHQVGQAHDDFFRALEASVLVFSALVVALMLQAIATDRRFALARVAQQARQDMSTGLLNDRGLIADLGQRLSMPTRPNYGLIGVHLSNFDTLNDLCGTILALQLEQSAASALMQQPGAKAAARLSAGRFALVIEADSVADVRAVARDVYSQFHGQLFKTEHGSVRLQLCVGGLLVDRHALINSEDCLMSLSDAMAIAASVRDPQLFVEPLSQTMIDARRAHQGKIEHIREAIRDKRFELHAQPMIDPDAPEGMLSYEILIRLLDRDGGLIRPPEFLSLAVQAQMTPTMDRGVIREIFSWLAARPDALARTWKCSINLSGLTMSDGTIAGFIREQRALYAIPPEKIVFEITESEAIRNPAAASRLVDDLKAEGFGIALDDFGTGLATFEYLKRFPLDYLKIDGSFIRNLVSNPIDEEIVMSTVRVARRLNICTVAEHVHNQDTLDRLADIGVDHIQGDWIGRAAPLEQMFTTPARRATPSSA
ncbi:MAG TPA: EAL domain-containing protein [Burkholderiaceae bacterium]|nr:EAL domain-containing protein [Burkholderiaceae bacterium]